MLRVYPNKESRAAPESSTARDATQRRITIVPLSSLNTRRPHSPETTSANFEVSCRQGRYLSERVPDGKSQVESGVDAERVTRLLFSPAKVSHVPKKSSNESGNQSHTDVELRHLPLGQEVKDTTDGSDNDDSYPKRDDIIDPLSFLCGALKEDS